MASPERVAVPALLWCVALALESGWRPSASSSTTPGTPLWYRDVLAERATSATTAASLTDRNGTSEASASHPTTPVILSQRRSFSETAQPETTSPGTVALGEDFTETLAEATVSPATFTHGTTPEIIEQCGNILACADLEAPGTTVEDKDVESSTVATTAAATNVSQDTQVSSPINVVLQEENAAEVSAERLLENSDTVEPTLLARFSHYDSFPVNIPLETLARAVVSNNNTIAETISTDIAQVKGTDRSIRDKTEASAVLSFEDYTFATSALRRIKREEDAYDESFVETTDDAELIALGHGLSSGVPAKMASVMTRDLGSNVSEYLEQRNAKVLNFFPIPVSEECVSIDNRRTGTCLNTYECRILEGESHGPCALGFGVCCVFAVSCGREFSNNVTYFLSPNFPELTRDVGACSVQVTKMAPEISQLRLDFIHFNLGQPNRRTGVCDSDVLVVSGGSGKDLRICGQNSGHHVYYDVENTNDSIIITMNLTKPNMFRLWEIKVTQVEFNQRAPAGCLQYYHGTSGVIQTLNFADNGRHLADQNYLICMRQEESMCSIVYEPCDENSFKIGPGSPATYDGSGYGADEMTRDCADKIVMPCDSEDFIMPKDSGGPSVCDLLHCGSSFCTANESPCRIESSTLPFHIGVQFGPGDREESPEDNLGACLRYEQQPCAP